MQQQAVLAVSVRFQMLYLQTMLGLHKVANAYDSLQEILYLHQHLMSNPNQK